PQDGGFRPSRAEAESAWNIGNYETAFQNFNGLLLLYSRDPLYKYYTGSCLVMLERDLPRAVTLLGSSINNSVNVKTVPDDVWFYYGRALQMNGSFSQATDAYDKFMKAAGKKESQQMDVQKYLDQCAKGQGALSIEQRAQVTEPMAQSIEHRALGTDNRENAKAKGQNITAEKEKEPVGVPEEYDLKLTRAVKLQYASDSLLRLAKGIRREMETAAAREPFRLKAENLEKEAAAMQAEADKIFLTLDPGDKPAAEVKAEVKAEAVTKAEAKVEVKAEDKARPEVKTGVEMQGRGEKEAVFSVFEVRTSPAYSSTVPIPVDRDAPPGLVYRIQLAAFKNAVPPQYFKGLYPLYAKVKPENGITYFYAGVFRTLDAAGKALPEARSTGFKDAFVIAFKDDIQISMERALLLEKEWSRKPLFFIEPGVSAGINNALRDSIPVGTLAFRAEVIRSKQSLKPEVIEKIALLAGRRGLEMIKNNQGETLCLVGNFITFESAEEYVSLMIRNGYSTARVVAYVGSYEIPVEAAKELLNKLQND
ncbi:MAG: hypothetical protein IH593_13780, partial [Bacteroidales bacterium]|nr:hypothetical protein [Bacteroidales bacterium]